MKFFKDENVRKKIFVGAFLILLFFFFYYLSSIWSAVTSFVKVIAPFIVGAAIAFVLNVPMRWIEKGLFKKKTGKRWFRFRRVLAMIITIVFAVVIISLILYMVIPQLATTIGQLIKQIPDGIRAVTEWANEEFRTNSYITEIIDDIANDWQDILEKSFSIIKSSINVAVEGGINAVTGIVSGVFNFIVGFIFALYILVQKEELGTHAKKSVYALLDRKVADEVMKVAALSSRTFANFISGQCVEAVILASMFSLSMTIIGIPYALLIGILIGATSLIPIIGSFIGCFIGALLIVLEDPVKALIFVILFLILQQIEGNLIYPKVVGDSVGLPGIWVLVSVTVGGSLFGVVGIVVFIPLVSILYSLFRRYVYGKLKKKKLLKGHDLDVPETVLTKEDLFPKDDPDEESEAEVAEETDMEEDSEEEELESDQDNNKDNDQDKPGKKDKNNVLKQLRARK